MQFHLMTTIQVNGFASVITNCLQAWGIAEKLHVVVRDNGSNFVAGR